MDINEKFDDNINKNNLDIEEYSFKNCDVILPNSNLTYNLISCNLKYSKKLVKPIYLTNINYKLKNKRKNYFKRKYDIAFIAYNWKRACKNYDLVLKIINSDLIKEKNILIIGLNQMKYENKNITSIDNLSKNEIYKIMEDIKILVIPSLYDSNPNTLVEAVSFGCNVVTSKNVGNSEFLRKLLIVENFKDVNKWISVINRCNKSYPYDGPKSEVIKNDLINFLDSKYNIKNVININDFNNLDFVGIYKIPAVWDLEKIPEKSDSIRYIKDSKIEFREHDNRFTNVNNIYFSLFKNINKFKNFKNSHFIYVDIYQNNNYKFKMDNINIWIVNNISFFNLIKNSKYYFLRGNYHNFYKQILNDKSFSIFYPATSFKFSYNFKNKIKRKLLMRKLEVKNINNYSLVLTHEDDFYQKVYKNSKLLLFVKNSSEYFYNKNLERIYDIIFVADATQKTKNHDLMFDFIKYYEYVKK